MKNPTSTLTPRTTCARRVVTALAALTVGCFLLAAVDQGPVASAEDPVVAARGDLTSRVTVVNAFRPLGRAAARVDWATAGNTAVAAAEAIAVDAAAQQAAANAAANAAAAATEAAANTAAANTAAAASASRSSAARPPQVAAIPAASPTVQVQRLAAPAGPSHYTVNVRTIVTASDQAGLAAAQSALDAGGVVGIYYSAVRVMDVSAHTSNNALALRLNVGDTVTFTGAITGIYRVTGSSMVRHVSSSLVLKQLGTAMAMQTCDGSSGMRIVGLVPA